MAASANSWNQRFVLEPKLFFLLYLFFFLKVAEQFKFNFKRLSNDSKFLALLILLERIRLFSLI